MSSHPSPRAVAYVRVSTVEQAREGVSLDAQISRVEAYCKMAGLELVRVVREEGVSASKPLASRPGGAEVLAALERGEVSHVVALKLDRLFRDAVDALTSTRTWEAAGTVLHLCDMGGASFSTGSAVGRMFVSMLAAFAELERNLISERTRTALQHLKSQGVKLGAPALEDVVTLARMRELRAAGMSLPAICEVLTTEGRRTLKGGKWWPTSVSRCLARQ